jgi:hypothetical protein
MARHAITCTIPAAEIVNSDVDLAVWSDDELLGRLHVSRGTIDWTPARSTTYCYSFAWERFAELMEEHGKRKRRVTVAPRPGR